MENKFYHMKTTTTASLVLIGLVFLSGCSFHLVNQTKQKALTPVAQQPVVETATWKTYKNSEWGFQISYPPQYRFLDNKANSEGSSHFLIPQKPPVKSGNYGTLIEIANITGTSTIKGILQMVISAYQAKNIDELNFDVQRQIASSTNEYKKNGILVSQSKINIDGQDFPAILLRSSGSTEMYVNYLRPSIEIFGRQQPPKVFMFKYAPGDDEIFGQIVASLKSIPVVASDASLYESAIQNKDIFWCDKISDSKLKDGCYIEVRGPIVDSFPIDFNTIEHNSGGKGGTVNGTTLSINRGKGSNVFLAGAISNKSNMNYIEFDVNMINGEQAQSLLTVYLNTTKIGAVDGRVQSGPGHYRFSAYLENDAKITDPITPGLYTLSFRLDAFADGTSSAKLSNIKGGLIH